MTDIYFTGDDYEGQHRDPDPQAFVDCVVRDYGFLRDRGLAFAGTREAVQA